MDVQLLQDFKEFLNLLNAMGVPPIRIEITTRISGVTFANCYAKRITDTLDQVTVQLISLHHLKINKRASGRHKDLDDVEHLP
jgi:hypothetical protein